LKKDTSQSKTVT